MKRIAVVIAVVLAGCVSPEQAYQNRLAAQQQQEQAQAQYRDGLFNSCRGLGYSEGTDQFRGCVLQLHAINQQRNAAVIGAVVGAAANAQAQDEAARRRQALPQCQVIGELANYMRSQGICR